MRRTSLLWQRAAIASLPSTRFPEQLFDVKFVAIALLATGHALYEEADPDELVEYRTVDRRLEERSSTEAARERAGDFLRNVEKRLGVHAWSDDALAALYGGESS